MDYFLPKFYPCFTRGPSGVLESQFKANKIDDVRDNHTEDPEEDNVKFSSALGMIFNESDQALRDLWYQKHAFNMLLGKGLAATEMQQIQGMQHVQTSLTQRICQWLVLLFFSTVKACVPGLCAAS